MAQGSGSRSDDAAAIDFNEALQLRHGQHAHDVACAARRSVAFMRAPSDADDDVEAAAALCASDSAQQPHAVLAQPRSSLALSAVHNAPGAGSAAARDHAFDAQVVVPVTQRWGPFAWPG